MPAPVSKLVKAADDHAFRAVWSRRSRGAIRTAHAVSDLAEPAVVFPVLALVGVLAARRGTWCDAARPIVLVAAGAAVRTRLSRAIARPRPPREAWLVEPDGFSFPSRHTTLAALAAGAVARGLGAGGKSAEAAPALAAVAVGASRICLGVHWPTDVLAGWAFAHFWLRLTASSGAGRQEAGGAR